APTRRPDASASGSPTTPRSSACRFATDASSRPPCGCPPATSRSARGQSCWLPEGSRQTSNGWRRSEIIGLSIRDGRFESATVRMPAGDVEVRARSVVLAAGGFEANLEWLAEIWGEAAKNFIIRGTPYNTGTVLRLMLDAGAEPVGDPAQCHAVAIDARAPKFDGGIVTRLDSVPLGIVVNRFGDRFYDEGEDYWPRRYAIWGRLVAQ